MPTQDTVVAQLLDELDKIPGIKAYQTLDGEGVDDKVFAHIHLSQEIKGYPQFQGLEADREKFVYKYVVNILKSFSSRYKDIHNTKIIHKTACDLENSKNLRTILDKAINLDLSKLNFGDDLDEARRKITSIKKRMFISNMVGILKDENPHVFQCGWADISLGAHAFLMEIQKTKNTYVVTSYDASMPMGYRNQHGSFRSYPAIQATYTVVDFEQDGFIPESDIISHESKLGELYDVYADKQSFQALQAGEEDRIYKKIYDSLFGGKKLKYPIEDTKDMGSGCCGWKCLMIFLKSRFEKDVYKRIKYEIQTKSLIDYYRNILSYQDSKEFDEHENATKIRHLRVALGNYARFIHTKIKASDKEMGIFGLNLCKTIQVSLSKLVPKPIQIEAIVSRTTGAHLFPGETPPDLPYALKWQSNVQILKKSYQYNSVPNKDETISNGVNTFKDITNAMRNEVFISFEFKSLEHQILNLKDFNLLLKNSEKSEFSKKTEKTNKEQIAEYVKSLYSLIGNYSQKQHNRGMTPIAALVYSKLFFQLVESVACYYDVSTDVIAAIPNIEAMRINLKYNFENFQFFTLDKDTQEIASDVITKMNSFSTGSNQRGTDAKLTVINKFLSKQREVSGKIDLKDDLVTSFGEEFLKKNKMKEPYKMRELKNVFKKDNLKHISTDGGSFYKSTKNGYYEPDLDHIVNIKNPKDLFLDHLDIISGFDKNVFGYAENCFLGSYDEACKFNEQTQAWLELPGSTEQNSINWCHTCKKPVNGSDDAHSCNYKPSVNPRQQNEKHTHGCLYKECPLDYIYTPEEKRPKKNLSEKFPDVTIYGKDESRIPRNVLFPITPNGTNVRGQYNPNNQECTNKLKMDMPLNSSIDLNVTSIESSIQFFENIFSNITHFDRRNLLMHFFFKQNLISDSIEKNPRLDVMVSSFAQKTKDYLDLLDDEVKSNITTKKHGYNFCHTLVALFYHQLSEEQKVRFQPTYEYSIQNNSYAKMVDIYFRLKKHIKNDILDVDNKENFGLLLEYLSSLTSSSSYYDITTVEKCVLNDLYRHMNTVFCAAVNNPGNFEKLKEHVQKIYNQQTNKKVKFVDAGLDTDGGYAFKIGEKDYVTIIPFKGAFNNKDDYDEVCVPEFVRKEFNEFNSVKKCTTNGSEYHFSFNKEKYCILYNELYFQRGDSWFKRMKMNNTSGNSIPPFLFNSKKYNVFMKCNSSSVSCEESILCVDKKTGAIEYVGKPTRSNCCTFTSSSHGTLQFFKAPSLKQPTNKSQPNKSLENQNLFEKFECCDFSEIYTDYNFVNLRRYGLSFCCKEEAGKKGIWWQGNDEYQLVELQRTEIERFDQYLAVQNSKFETKILVPIQSYINLQDNKNILDTTGWTVKDKIDSYKSQHYADNSQYYAEFSVDSLGKLTAIKITDKIYLMYLFMGQGQYERAFDLLKEIEGFGYYDLNEVTLSLANKIFDSIPVEESGQGFIVENAKLSALRLRFLNNVLCHHLVNHHSQQNKSTDLKAELFKNAKRCCSKNKEKYEMNYNNVPEKMRLTGEQLISIENFSGISFENTRCLKLKVEHFGNVDSGLESLSALETKYNKTHDISLRKTDLFSAPNIDFENNIENFKNKEFPWVQEFHIKTNSMEQEQKKDETQNSLENDMSHDAAVGQVRYNRLKDFREECVKNIKNQAVLRSTVQTTLSDLASKVNTAWNDVLELSLKNFRQQEGAAEHLGQILGEERTEITHFDLIQLYLKKDKALYRAKLGKITDNEIEELYQKTQKWLELSTDHQYFTRLYIKSQSNNQDELAEVLSEKRAYTSQDENQSYFLAYEFLSGNLLRPIQRNMLSTLLEKDKCNAIQLIMGGGKSKVLMPLSCYLKADGTRLVGVIVPEALYETNLRDLSANSKKLSGQSAVPFLFSRECVPFSTDDTQSDSLKSIEYLRNLRNTLIEAVQNKNYIVTTKTSILSLQSSYEATLTECGSPVQVALFEEILNILESQGDFFIDEVDTILRVKEELNYTVSHNISPEDSIINLQVDFFRFLCQTENKDGKVLYEKLIEPNLFLRKEEFNETLNTIRNALIKQDFFKQCFEKANLTDTEKQEITDFLFSPQQNLNMSAPNAISKLSDSGKDIVAFYRAQFTNILPLILSKEENVNYGLDHPGSAPYDIENCEGAIPYAGNNTPKKESKFANIYEIFGYTGLVHLRKKEGVSKELLSYYFKEQIEKYDVASSDEEKRYILKSIHRDLHLSETDIKSEGFPLCDLKNLKTSLEEVVEFFLNFYSQEENKEKRTNTTLFFLKEYIFKSIRLYKYMINATPTDMTKMLKVVTGASGTIDNPAILDNLHFERSVSLGTDGLTLAALKDPSKTDMLNLSKSFNRLTLSGPDKIRQYLINVQACAQKEVFSRYQAIMDVGSYFSGISNEEVAAAIAKFYSESTDYTDRYKHVLYFNKQGVLCAKWINPSAANTADIEIGSSDAIVEVLSRQPGCENYSRNDYFMYFDQTHTVGTDIKLAIKDSKNKFGALSLLNVSPLDTQSGVLQAAMRNRDLTNSQGISFVSDKVLQEHLNIGNVKTSDVLSLIQKNLINQVQDDAFIAVRQTIKSEYKRAVLKLVRNQEINYQTKRMLLKIAKDIIYTDLDTSPRNLFLHTVSMQDAKNIVKKDIETFDKILRKVLEHVPTLESVHAKDVKKDAEAIMNKNLPYCKEQYPDPSGQNDQKEVHIEAKQEISLKVEQEQDQEKFNEIPKLTFSKRAHQCWTDASDLNDFPGAQLQSMATCPFNDNIFISNNLCLTEADFFQNAPHTVCHFVLYMKDKVTEKQYAVMLSDQDASEWRDKLQRGMLGGLPDPNSLIDKFDIRVDTLSGFSGKEVRYANEQEKADWEAMLDQMRFVSGDIQNILFKEEGWFWKSSLADMQTRLKFYRETVGPQNPTTLAMYRVLVAQVQKRIPPSERTSVTPEIPREAPWNEKPNFNETIVPMPYRKLTILEKEAQKLKQWHKVVQLILVLIPLIATPIFIAVSLWFSIKNLWLNYKLRQQKHRPKNIIQVSKSDKKIAEHWLTQNPFIEKLKSSQNGHQKILMLQSLWICLLFKAIYKKYQSKLALYQKPIIQDEQLKKDLETLANTEEVKPNPLTNKEKVGNLNDLLATNKTIGHSFFSEKPMAPGYRPPLSTTQSSSKPKK